jgi:hypothetical protein
MAEQYGIRNEAVRLGDNVGGRHRAEFGIDQPHDVTVVDQRAADREQAERRQMIVRNPASDRGMRHVDEKNTHGLSLPLWLA